MQKSVIIVAGGKGLRMGHDLPKQFIVVGDKPVLMHTMEAFYNYDKEIEIVLVLAASYPDYWAQICNEYNFSVPHKITIGGDTRYHSVKNGLSLASGDFIAVHDAARPFVTTQLIARCFDVAMKQNAVIPVLDATDSLREMIDDTRSHIIDRSRIKLVQTPQIFASKVIKDAYQMDFQTTFTDDASVVESSGVDIHLVEGETSNIKITTPLDLEIAKLLIVR